MGKNQAASGLTNIIQYDSRGNITFVSGSTTLMSVSSSGAITTTGTISGSDAVNALLLNGTGSLAFTTTASYNVASASLSSRTTQVERTYASTGSNTFTGAQFISDTSNAISFTSTASLYSNGGLRVQGNSFVSGTAYFNNIVVYGTSSIQYITSSQVNVGTNIITVNTDTPAIRFGGLSVFDSGSIGLTGSILWDSEKNHWVYSNPSGSSYSGGMLISGPRSSALGSEQGTTSCMLLVGQGGDHLTSSMIYHDSARTCFYTNATLACSNTFGSNLSLRQTFTGSVQITGSLIVNTTAPELQVNDTGVILGNLLTDNHNITGSLRITGSGNHFVMGGNFGIGTTTPTAKLQIIAPESTSGLDSFGVVGQNNLKSVQLGATSSYAWIQSHGSVPLRINELGNNVLIATGGSNVGIGTTTPTRTLQVKNNSEGQTAGISGATYGIRFDNGGANSPNMSTIHGTDSTLAGSYQPIMLNGLDVRFGTSDTERMRISSGGNTCIFCQLSIGPVVVIGNQGGSDTTVLTGGSGQGSVVRMNFANGSYNNFLAGNGDNFFNCVTGRLNAAGGVKFSGGNTTLNYYESGTWTPQLYWTGGGNYCMGGINGGNYVRIGNVVSVNYHLQWFGLCGSSGFGGQLRIGGLPFAIGSYRSAGTISAISSGIGRSTADITWHANTVDPGANFIYWIENNPAGGYSHSPSVGATGLVYSNQVTYTIQ